MRVLAFPVVAWLHLRGRDVGIAFLAAVQRGRSRTRSCTPWSTRSSSPARSSSGGRSIGLDPTPWRMGHPGRLMHTFMQMMQNTFLAVVILFASGVLYPHYETLVRTLGADPAGRPAPGRRPHVVHRRPDLPHGAHGASSRAGSGPTPATAPGPTVTRRPRWPRSASASSASPSGWPESGARRLGNAALPRRADAPADRLRGHLPGIGAARYSR